MLTKAVLQSRAHQAVGNAKRKGLLVQKPCEVCGKSKSFAHHYLGYAKENQLKVQWLCYTHHHIAHFDNPTQKLKYSLISYIASDDATVEQLLAIRNIIKQSTNQ